MAKKKRIREQIEIEYNGKTYMGERVIEGTRKLDQYVIYKDKCIPDLKGYEPDQKDTVMLSIAKSDLSKLVSGRTLSAQPCKNFGL